MTVAAKRRRGRPKIHEERVDPTPETAAKLEPDPLFTLLWNHGGRDKDALEDAIAEIRGVYMAIVRSVMRRGGLRMDAGGMPDIPPFLAWAHAQTYLPWAREQHPRVMEACIDLIIDRQPVYPAFNIEVMRALRNYAKRMTERKSYRPEENT